MKPHPEADDHTHLRAPGPTNGPFGIRHIYFCNTRPLAFYERLGSYGDIATFRMFGVRAFFVNAPELINAVLRDTGTRFRKHPRNMRALARGLGQGLLVAEGDDWLTARRLVQPSFNQHALAAIVADAVPSVTAMLDRWSHKTEIELFAEMNRLTVDVAARALLGVELAAEAQHMGAAARALAESWAHATRQIIPLPSWLPLPRQRQERQAIHYLRTAIDRIIRARRASGGGRPDLLSRLITAYDAAPGDPSANHERLIDQVLTLFIAAYHASTATLCWTFYLLARNSTVHGQVLDEIETVLGKRQPTIADLEKLPLTENVLKESMRLYPSAWEMFPREAVTATQLGDWQIPRGAWLILSPYVTHRDPRFFIDPLKFDPDRWSPSRLAEIDPRAYFPFGGGRHVCIGRDMAMAQNTLMLVMILRQYQMQLVQQEHLPARLPPLSLIPRDPMRVTLTPRPTGYSVTAAQEELLFSI